MANRALEFGVVMISSGCTPEQWKVKCRRAEDLGYDVIGVPDHLNLMSPFPSAVLAGAATTRARIATYVVNSNLYNRALLARDIATTDLLLDGRLELGLGTGYVEREFEAAGIPFGTPADRVAGLESAVTGLEELLGAEDSPLPVQRPRPPLVVGGHGKRVLRLAAHEAEVVSFTGAPFRPEFGRTGLVDAPALRERVGFVRRECAGRTAPPVFNVLSKQTVLTTDRRAAAAELGRYAPDLGVDQLLEVPTLFIGTARQIAEQLHRHSEDFGITYFTVMEPALEDFAKVIEQVR
ncbi:TIGR03621 family F420-dependent LLM class oxidoreductase [Streptomonospora litoralis]|uniref:Methylenetetrahydromethanopterin reductase n=1 Tax=Streptomonospora litoralis TaxID=2498135 RepID=A0A4P6Q2T3_9ACTN|nr:TIGR03621 family F420-dependent LLM class oxidoreductase [Streptomonospora litoralis]QBI54875.1 methylenetetrahydromethanopterin reductase [Streptomonospora litoralis]